MTSSERNILSYFKETKEKQQPAKRLKLDETDVKVKVSSSQELGSLRTNQNQEFTKICLKEEKICVEEEKKPGKGRQVSIQEAFERTKKLSETPSRSLINECDDTPSQTAETPKQPSEAINNRKRRIDSEPDLTPSTKTVGSVAGSTTKSRSNGTPASVKKRLIMSDEVAQPSPKEPQSLLEDISAKKVPFTVKGQLSPLRVPVEIHIARVNCTPENTRTPVKRISGTPDIKSPRAKQLFGSPSKKLNPLEVRAKLGKVGKLSELQARLASVNENLQRIHSFREAHAQVPSPKKTESSLRKFDILDVEVPASPRKLDSPRKIDPSPIKGSSTPAYERYHNLAQPGPPTLTLPYKFKVLEEMFRCMDVVSSFMYNRQERITFKKLKAGVQEMLRRDFTKHHVRQIVAVFPESFKISYEKVQTRFTQASPGKDESEMVIGPIVAPNLRKVAVSKKEKSVDPLKMLDFKPMPPTALLERRTIFHSKLVALVKQHHTDYLASLIPPVVVPEDKLTKWHPCFPLDEIPDVDPRSYPESPVKNKVGSAKEILEKAHTLLSKNLRVLDALTSAAKREASAASQANESQKPEQSEAPLNPALKGIPQALLDKIRAREAEKMKMSMTQNPEDIKAGQMAGRLPELARTIAHIFVTDKKPALAKDVLCKRMAESTKLAASQAAADEHLQLIAKICPDWLTLHQLQGKTFIKVNKKIDINTVMASLEKFKKASL